MTTPTTKHDEIRDQQRAAWNKFAAGWQKWDERMQEFFAPFGNAMIESARLKEDSQVLDIACGTGEPGLSAAGKVGKGKVVGTDLAEDMVQYAGQNAKDRGITNFECCVCDCSVLPFPIESFDSVLCRFGIMFFPDPSAGIREMVRVLKPGGTLVVAVWGPAERNPWASTIGKVVTDTLNLPKPPPDAPGIFRFAEAGAAAGLLKAAGLTNVEEKTVEGSLDLPSPKAYWEMMTEVAAPIASALNQADAFARERVRAHTAAAAAKFAGPKGLSMPALVYVVTGVK